MPVNCRRRRTAARSHLMLSFTAMALVFSLLGAVDWGSAIAETDQGSDGTPEVALLEETQLQDGQQHSEPEVSPATEVPLIVPAPSTGGRDELPADPTEEPPATEEPVTEPSSTIPVLHATTEEPLATEIPEDSEEPGGLTLVGPTVVVLEGEGTGVVHLIKYTCPPGYDTSGAGFALLEEECRDDAVLTDFTVSDAGEYSENQTARLTLPPFMQQADFTGVPATTISISETILPGFGEPIVYCGVGATTVAEWMPQTVSGGNTVTWDLARDTAVDCYFFNTQIGDDEPQTGDAEPQTGDVTVSKYTCPAGVERGDVAYTLSEQCNEEVAPVSFTLGGGDGYLATQATSVGAPQSTIFADVPFGTIEIEEAVPAGYGEPLAFCADTAADGPGAYEPVAIVDGHSMFWEHGVSADIPLTCLFFNFQNSADTIGDVHISKYTCHSGYTPLEDDYLMSEQCREDVAPVEFMVLAEGGFVEVKTASPGVPQQVTFNDVPFGEIGIVEVIPSGYGEPLVFCTDIPADGPGAYEPVPLVSDDAVALDHRVDAEIPLSCIFFNFEDDEGDSNTLRLDKWTCPLGTDRESGLPDLGTSCDRMPGISFALHAGDGAYGTTDAAGEIEWTGIPAGGWSVFENIPEGYGEPVVFCGPMFETETPRVDVTDATFGGEFAGTGETTVCSVFNIQEESENTVTANKYICPPDANPEEDILLDVCSLGGDGIPFEFVDGLGRHFGTVTDGVVEWTGVYVGIGELQIIETIPSGWGDPLVVCDGLRMTSTNGLVMPDPGVADPFHIVCDFFNFIPGDTTLTTIKHECPPGYDPEGFGADPETDCPTLVDGVDFHLAGPDTDLMSTTGDAGTGMVAFGIGSAGDYALTETVPEGTEWSFVSDCYGNAVGAVQPYPLATGETLNLTIHAGEYITCHWFNVMDQDRTSLSFHKYTCATTTFVSDVDCEVFEGGQGFDLVVWTGDAWEYLATATTDGYGFAMFGPLEPGKYWLDEHDGDWCHIASEQLSDDGNWLNVSDDQETVVKIYNCDGVPGKPGKTPTKYPNTGIPMREDWRLVA